MRLFKKHFTFSTDVYKKLEVITRNNIENDIVKEDVQCLEDIPKIKKMKSVQEIINIQNKYNNELAELKKLKATLKNNPKAKIEFKDTLGKMEIAKLMLNFIKKKKKKLSKNSAKILPQRLKSPNIQANEIKALSLDPKNLNDYYTIKQLSEMIKQNEVLNAYKLNEVDREVSKLLRENKDKIKVRF